MSVNQLKTRQNILKIVSSIEIDKINIWCEFQVFAVVELQQIKKVAI